jgi:hypothetical protein
VSGIFYSIYPDSHNVAELCIAVHAACALRTHSNTSHPRQTVHRNERPRCSNPRCDVTRIRIPTTLAPSAEEKTDGGGDRKTPGGGTTAPDDGELVGWHSTRYCMEVWDDYERE